MLAAGIPIEHSKGEAGRGQHEVNFTYGTALETADRHLVFKNGVKEIAAQCGRSASFMAKWTMDDSGSSCHMHASLWDRRERRPAHVGPRRARPLVVRRYGSSSPERSTRLAALRGYGRLT